VGKGREINNLSQQPFGRLRALRYHGPSGHGAMWECLCDPLLGGCGNTCLARSDRLVAGTKASCGCLKASTRPPKRPPKEPPKRYDADGFELPDNPSKRPRSVADVQDDETFGKLYVMRPCGDGKPGWAERPNPPRGQTFWLCQCKCGNYALVRADRLAYRTTKSCGCKAVKAIRSQIKRYEGRLAYAVDTTRLKAEAVWKQEAAENPNPYARSWVTED
jgi:uncharacterized cysteine cluster protein YcgN (CxxCxxCC family)